MSPALQAYFYLYSLSHTGSPQWTGKLVNMEPENKEDWPYLHSKSRKTYNLLRKALALSLSYALLWGEHLYISDRFIIWCFKEETEKKKKGVPVDIWDLKGTLEVSFFLPLCLVPLYAGRCPLPTLYLYWYPFRNWYCVCAISALVCPNTDYWMREASCTGAIGGWVMPGLVFRWFLSSCCCLTSYNNSGLIYSRRCNSLKNHSYWDFPSSSAVKNPPASAGDMGLTPRLGRSPGGGNSPVFWPGKIPWTEEPGRLQSIGLQRVRHDWSDLAHTHPFPRLRHVNSHSQSESKPRIWTPWQRTSCPHLAKNQDMGR